MVIAAIGHAYRLLLPELCGTLVVVLVEVKIFNVRMLREILSLRALPCQQGIQDAAPESAASPEINSAHSHIQSKVLHHVPSARDVAKTCVM